MSTVAFDIEAVIVMRELGVAWDEIADVLALSPAERTQLEHDEHQAAADARWQSWEAWIDQRRGRPTNRAPQTDPNGACLHSYCSKPSTRILTLDRYLHYLPLRGVNEANGNYPDAIPLCRECYALATEKRYA